MTFTSLKGSEDCLHFQQARRQCRPFKFFLELIIMGKRRKFFLELIRRATTALTTRPAGMTTSYFLNLYGAKEERCLLAYTTNAREGRPVLS